MSYIYPAMRHFKPGNREAESRTSNNSIKGPRRLDLLLTRLRAGSSPVEKKKKIGEETRSPAFFSFLHISRFFYTQCSLFFLPPIQFFLFHDITPTILVIPQDMT